MRRSFGPIRGAILAGLLIGWPLPPGPPPARLAPPEQLFSQIIEPTPKPPIEENPTPPIEQSPTPPEEQSPQPPEEQNPTPPIEQNPTPPEEQNPTPPMENRSMLSGDVCGAMGEGAPCSFVRLSA